MFNKKLFTQINHLINGSKIEQLIKKKNHIDEVKPVFSVVIPVYDRVAELREAVDSVLSQTFCNFEVLLICDGSPEATLEVVDNYTKHPQIRSFKFDDNSGNACRGRNKGIELSRGEFIALLDSDDICKSDRLAKTYRLFLLENADVVSGSVEFLVDGSRKIDGIVNGQIETPIAYDFELMKRFNLISTCTVAVRKKCLLKYGVFRKEMEYREDHELWLRLGYKGCKIVCTNEVLSKYRVHSGNAELKFIEQDDKWYRLMLEMFDQDYRLS